MNWLKSLLARFGFGKPPREAEIWNFVLRGERREIGAINEALERAAGASGAPEAAIRKVQIALDELLTNAISYQGVNASNPAKVDVLIDARQVSAVLRYGGPNFNPFTEVGAPDLNANIKDRKIGGLGVHLVKELMDDYRHSFDEGLNQVIIASRF